MTLVTVTAAKGIKVRVQASDNWWTSMSPEQQEAYLREHPESKMGGANSRRYEGEDDSVEAPKKNGTSKDTKPKSNKTPTEPRDIPSIYSNAKRYYAKKYESNEDAYEQLGVDLDNVKAKIAELKKKTDMSDAESRQLSELKEKVIIIEDLQDDYEHYMKK